MVEKIRVAFIDDDLDNWHAKTFLELARGPFAERVEVIGGWGLKAERSRAWAQARGLAWADDPAALAARCDAVMVLAPSDPTTHLELCRAVLPAGKPTYVDKTFAPDLGAAREIFALADRHGAPVQSTSVLRYTSAHRQAKALGPVRHVEAWSGGSSYGEYAIHPLELGVSLLGHEATRVMRRGDDRDVQLIVDFAGDRTLVANVFTRVDPKMAVTITGDRTEHVAIDRDPIFQDGFAAIVDFLASGTPNVDRRETLAIRAIMDAAESPAARVAPVKLATATAAAAR